MDELKPCPFCGGRPYFYEKTFLDRDGKERNPTYTVICENCFAKIVYHTTDVVWMWNRRAKQLE
ncbi:MAG: Lar family restriction alleviation protein [Clostridia bacterium]|nr:Lar family restriction alleviation protein [Clostridia bacterium]